MSEFDFDLDHLDFDSAAKNSELKQKAAEDAAAELAQAQDDSDDCAGGACKI